jgi:hypothetical protein
MTTKQAIFEAIDRLPEQHLTEVLHYIQQLTNDEKSPLTKPTTPISDPLADFIGAVSRGSLATNLDRAMPS